MSTPGLPALTPVGTDPPGTTRAATPHTRGGGAAISHAQWGHHPHALHGAPTSHAERGHRPRALEGAIPMHTWRGRRPHMHDGGIAPVRLHRLHHPPPPRHPTHRRTETGVPGAVGLGAAPWEEVGAIICLFVCLWPRRGWRGSSPRGRCRSGCRECSPSSARPRAAPAPAGRGRVRGRSYQRGPPRPRLPPPPPQPHSR